MAKFFAGVGVTIFIVLIAGGAYLLGRGQFGGASVAPSPVATTVSQTIADTSPSPSASPTSDKTGLVNPSLTIVAIAAAVTKNDYSQLPKYMTDSQDVVIYASSCCGKYTKAKTIQETSGYLKDAKGPWDFSANNSISKKLEVAQPQYFKDFVIGIATGSRHVVAFHLNEQFLIDKVTLLVDYQLLVP
jgi:hypothetical protein